MPNVDIRPTNDRKFIQLKIILDNGKYSEITLPPDTMGIFAMAALGASAECADKAGKQHHLTAKAGPDQAHFVGAHEVALADVPGQPDLVAIHFAVGATELGIGLPRAQLQSLAQAMLAASADRAKPQ